MTGSRAYVSRAIASAVGETSSRMTRHPSCVRNRDSHPVPAPNSSTVRPRVSRKPCSIVATPERSGGVSSGLLNGLAR